MPSSSYYLLIPYWKLNLLMNLWKEPKLDIPPPLCSEQGMAPIFPVLHIIFQFQITVIRQIHKRNWLSSVKIEFQKMDVTHCPRPLFPYQKDRLEGANLQMTFSFVKNVSFCKTAFILPHTIHPFCQLIVASSEIFLSKLKVPWQAWHEYPKYLSRRLT